MTLQLNPCFLESSIMQVLREHTKKNRKAQLFFLLVDDSMYVFNVLHLIFPFNLVPKQNLHCGEISNTKI